MFRSIFIFFLFAMIAFIILGPIQQSIALADDNKDQLELEKLKVELEKSKLELEKNKIDYQKGLLPQPKSTLPDGSLTTDKLDFFPTVQVYRSSKEIMEHIGNKIPSGAKKIIITDNAEMLTNYSVYKIKYDILIKFFESLSAGYDKIPDMKIFDISAPVSYALSFADIWGLTKTDIKIEGTNVDLKPSAIISQLIYSLKHRENNTLEEIYYDKFPPVSDDVTLSAKLQECFQKEIFALIKIKANEKFIEENKNNKKLAKEVKEKQENSDGLNALNAAFQDQVKQFLTGANSLLPKLQTFLLYKSLEKDKSLYHIYMEPIKGGGHTKSVRGLFNNGSISFGGGAIITYYILDYKGNIEETNTVYTHEPFERVREGGTWINDNLKD
jgi:hypothetical protein